MVNLFSFASFIDHQILPDENRRSNIYQIAIAMDFNSHFRCANATAEFDNAVFMGADQKRALIAPPLLIKKENPKSLFKLVAVPQYFRSTTCE